MNFKITCIYRDIKLGKKRIRISHVHDFFQSLNNNKYFETTDVNINSLKQNRKSKIDLIELGFTYDKLLTNLFLNKNKIQFNYIKFRDLTLNARIKEDNFLPGPLVKIFSLINENNFQSESSLKRIFDSKIVIGKINLLLINDKDSHSEETAS